jgi:DNA-binding NarL/FixJ family response regulator
MGDAAISLLVVDDHPVFVDALCLRLRAEPDLAPVRVAHDATEAVRQVRRGAVDVAIVDYRLGEGTGIDLVAEIGRVSPSTRAVMLSGVDSAGAVVAALRAGAMGWVSKSLDVRTLVQVVHRIHRGAMWLEPAMLSDVLQRLVALTHGPEPDVLAVLTAREREVLECLAQAMSRRQIAEELGMSENTVRTHVQHLLAKLGAHTSVEAVSILLRATQATRPVR